MLELVVESDCKAQGPTLLGDLSFAISLSSRLSFKMKL